MNRALLALVIAAGCKADLPELTDANRPLDATCKGPHADTLVDRFPSTLANAPAALGAPDGAAVALAANQVITVGFVGLGAVTDASGPDLKIHGMIAAGATATIRLAAADMQFRFAGDITAMSTEVDVAVADLSAAVYVRIIAVTGTINVDAIQATHDVCR